MSQTIKVRRGEEASLPTLNLGEFGYTTDTKKLYIGNGVGNTLLCSVDLTDGGETTLHTHDHTTLSNVGTNTHAEIDSHIANTSDPHSVLPSQTGNDDKYLQTNGTSVLWATVSAGGSSNYEVKTTNFTAETGTRYALSGAITATLPAAPSAGNCVIFAPVGDWVTSTPTIARNGNNIEGAAEDISCVVNSEFKVIYVSAATGWKVVGSYNGDQPHAYYA